MANAVRVTVRWCVASIVAASFISVSASAALAQDERLADAHGIWIGGAMLVGGALLDANSSRPWEQVGHPGPGIGGAFAAGYDGTQLGTALGLEAASMSIGGRRGTNLALAATIRWRPPIQTTRWEPRIEVGYVRFGLGAVRVTASELPPDLFRSGALGGQGVGEEMLLLGNGVRLGYSLERAWIPGTNIVLGLGADAVYFDTAAYQGYDESLAKPGWGVMPRIILGVRSFPRALHR
jgi:hypothetical protein